MKIRVVDMSAKVSEKPIEIIKFNPLRGRGLSHRIVQLNLELISFLSLKPAFIDIFCYINLYLNVNDIYKSRKLHRNLYERSSLTKDPRIGQ